MNNKKLSDSRIQKKIFGQVRRAIQDYKMIDEGDKIAVGLSGGKDSLTLLLVLNSLRRFYPKQFSLEAITINLGVGSPDFLPIVNLCKDLSIGFTLVNTLIGKIVDKALKGKNPCWLCSSMRRAALIEAGKNLNCNKIALGHNKDDLVETFALSLLYEGRINTFSPVTYLSREDILLIRPLIYSSAGDIKGFVKAKGLVEIANPCGLADATKRDFIRRHLAILQKDIPETKENIFGAIKRSNIAGWAGSVENQIQAGWQTPAD